MFLIVNDSRESCDTVVGSMLVELSSGKSQAGGRSGRGGCAVRWLCSPWEGLIVSSCEVALGSHPLDKYSQCGRMQAKYINGYTLSWL